MGAVIKLLYRTEPPVPLSPVFVQLYCNCIVAQEVSCLCLPPVFYIAQSQSLYFLPIFNTLSLSHKNTEAPQTKNTEHTVSSLFQIFSLASFSPPLPTNTSAQKQPPSQKEGPSRPQTWAPKEGTNQDSRGRLRITPTPTPGPLPEKTLDAPTINSGSSTKGWHIDGAAAAVQAVSSLHTHCPHIAGTSCVLIAHCPHTAGTLHLSPTSIAAHAPPLHLFWLSFSTPPPSQSLPLSSSSPPLPSPKQTEKQKKRIHHIASSPGTG